MPMESDEKLKEILKTMVSFNVETDLDDDESREELVNYFREIVSSEDDLVKSFLPKLFDSMTTILVDMNIMEPIEGEEQPTDDDLANLGEPTNESLNFGVKSISERANDFLM